MGLDMWLYAKKYIWIDDKELQNKVNLYPELKLIPKEITFQFMEWRKANAIHNWFVENVQSGEDDCRNYNVDLETLRKLLNIINEILGKDNKEKIVNSLTDDFNIEKAKELLPSKSGFFYGGTEYDKYYLEDLKYTQKKLNKLFNNEESYENFDFEYSSSW